MFQKGEFVKWTGTDEQGKFSHVGEVASFIDERLTLIVSPAGSTMTIDLLDMSTKDEFKVVNKPKGWKLVKPEAEKVEPVSIKKPTTKVVKKSTDGKSKKEFALDIYKGMMENGNHPVRKEVIARFVSELNMTPAGASTYAATCKKECSA